MHTVRIARKERLPSARRRAADLASIESEQPGALPLDVARQAYLDALHIPAAALVLEADEARVLSCNAAFQRMAGGDSIPHILAEAADFLLRNSGQQQELSFREPGAGGRHLNIHFARLPELAPHAARALVSVIDRTAEVETERSLRAEMLHDSLTGLPNRTAFIDALDAAFRAGDEDFAVLAIDLSRFSRINECVGALAGDELIITVARRLVSALTPGGMLARMGSDEFAVLLRNVDGAGAMRAAAERFLAVLSGPFRLAELEIRVDCAIGCVLRSDRAPTSSDVLRHAQVALKRAKQSGVIEAYRPSGTHDPRRRFSLETDLRRAIEREQLSLAFQPLVNLEKGVVSGFEALARWEHPEQGPISPAEFIAVAEDSGLIVPLGRWAMRAAMRTLQSWDKAAGRTLPINICVNISPVQLARDSVVMAVRDTLADVGTGGERLTLELTESSIVADPDRAKSVLDQLKAFGCRIAMDDFGTGYSSLSSLQKLPIDVLKIDRSFVTGLLDDRDSIAIVRAILSLADALGMSTTAEGVESSETARMLGALGCKTGQGYHFARPLAADQAYDFLRATGSAA